MNAIPFTASRWRLAQSKPRAEPQSWTTSVTCSCTSRSWSRASRYLRCSTKRYEPGPLSGSLSESPMPIRSGAMQRPRGCRCGNTLRQRYDEVGLPCSSTMGSPFPTSTYAISRPRTRRRCFWYGKAALLVGVRDIAMLMKALLLGWRSRARRRTTHCVSVRGSLAMNGSEQRAFARENSVMACRIVPGVMHSGFGGSSGHRARYVAPRYANAQLHMRLDGMIKGGKVARPWSMRLATAGRDLKPPTCEPQSNYSLDELAHDAAPIEDGRLRPAHAAVS